MMRDLRPKDQSKGEKRGCEKKYFFHIKKSKIQIDCVYIQLGLLLHHHLLHHLLLLLLLLALKHHLLV